jgi:hypothetical protein
MQARNISITVRTLIQGLTWLATFLFCANSVGLFGEACHKTSENCTTRYRGPSCTAAHSPVCPVALLVAGLSIQMALFPETLKADEEDRAARRAAAEAAGPQLPKVAITANPAEMKRAFQAAESMGKKAGALEAASISEASAAASSSSDSN